MVIGTITMVERGATPGLLAKAHNEAAKEGWQETGRYWVANIRDKHFTQAGAREYGYTKRKGEGMAVNSKGFKRSYTGRKKARFGHTDPLTYSGSSRRGMQSAKVSATGKGGTIRMASGNLGFRPPNSQINMREEMARISQGEAPELANVLARNYHNNINRAGGTKTTTIK